MYEIILFVHSWLRWFIVFFLIIHLLKSLLGWLKHTHYLKLDYILGAILIGLTHLQLLIGFFLYFSLSPITNAALNNINSTMKNPLLRFWGIEHIATMVFFVIFLQIGRILTKRSSDNIKKHKLTTIFLSISLFILILGMPWPSRKDIGRPLFMKLSSETQQILNQ